MNHIEEQYDKIYRYCYYKVRNRDLAEDITQEAFLRGIEAQGTGFDIRYLYRIAHNLCIDEYRRVKADPIDDVDVSDGTNLSETVVDSIVIKEALQKLSEEEREVLLLRYANEEPISVICSIYGKSRFAVYRWIQSILKKCRNYTDGGNS
jgi:RNA polymerase sigma-70 factor (ECF subfamily)